MAVTVEALELNVKSSADSAATSVQALIEKLRTLKQELTGKFATGFGSEISKEISGAMKNVGKSVGGAIKKETQDAVKGVGKSLGIEIGDMTKAVILGMKANSALGDFKKAVQSGNAGLAARKAEQYQKLNGMYEAELKKEKAAYEARNPVKRAVTDHSTSHGPNLSSAEYKALGSDYSRTYNAQHPEYVAWAALKQQETKAFREYMANFEAHKAELIAAGKFAGAYDANGKFTPYNYPQETTATTSPGVQEVKQEAKDAKAPVAGLTGELKNLDKELKQKPGDSKKAASGLNLFKGAVNLVKNAVKNNSSAMNHHAKAHNGLLSQFARVAKMRAMRYVIRSITAGLKEGIGNLYQYSKAMKGSFAKSMDTAASTMLTLKNSIATALAPVIEALVPVLQKVVGWVREGCNWLAQFFALMRGQSTWTKAVDYATEYAAATKSANDNTKEMLASFDELNVISSESGSGSNKVQTNPKKMFTEETTFDQSIIPWANKAKEILGWIKQTAKEIWDIVWPAVQKLAPVVGDAISALLPVIKDVVETLTPIIGDIIETVTPIIGKIIKMASDFIKNIWPVLKPIVKWLGDNLEWILPLVVGIKLALKGWQIASGLLGGLGKAKDAIGGILDSATALAGIGTIFLTISITRKIQDTEERRNAIENAEPVSDELIERTRQNSVLDAIGGILIGKGTSAISAKSSGLFSKFIGNIGDWIGAGSVTSSIFEKLLGFDPWTMITDVYDYTKKHPDGAFKSGYDNVWARVSSLISPLGVEKGSPSHTMRMLNSIGIPTNWNELLKDGELGYTEAGKEANNSVIEKGYSAWKVAERKAELLKKFADGTMTFGEMFEAAKKGIVDFQSTVDSIDFSVPGHEVVKFGEQIDALSDKEIDAPEVNPKEFTKSLKQLQEIALIAGDKTDDILDHWDLIAPYVNDDNYCNSTIAITTLARTTGTDVKSIMDHWKFVAPYIDEKNLQKSTMDIIKLSKDTGVNVTSIMAQWKFIAPDIDKHGFEETAFWIVDIAAATGLKTEDIINAWKFISPGLKYHDFEKTSLMLGAFAKTEGIDISEIIREWEFIAPYIDDSKPLESAYEIAKLIVDSGENWKEELKKIPLKTNKIEVPDSNVSGQVQSEVKKGQAEASLVKNTIKLTSKLEQVPSSEAKTLVTSLQSFFTRNKPKVDVDLSYAQKKIDNWNPFANIEKKAKTLFDFFPDLSSNKTSTSTSTGGFTRTVYREYVDESSDPDGFIWTDDWDDEVRKMILGYAGGGFPQSGNLFLAHENGAPEYVGQFGSHTAVANNEQIVRGIAGGVEQAMRGVEERLARIEQYAGITAGKDPTVKITPSAALGRVNAQSAALYGQITGR